MMSSMRTRLLSLALTLLPASWALADTPPYNTPDRFIPAAEAGLQDTVPGGLLMILAYLIGWLVLFGYVAFLLRSQRQAGEALKDARLRQEELEERVEALEGGTA